jgi:ABC-2 type transport system permease protein
MLVLPLLMMAFLQPASRAMLVSEGYMGANGAEQVVPGLAVLFTFLSITFIGALFFREYAWGTWERLRASSARSFEIVIGKCVPTYLLILLQLLIFFLTGVFLFGLHIRGSLLALALMMVCQAFCLVGVAMAWVAISKSFGQFLVLTNLGGLLFTGIGGALVPSNDLPVWVQVIAPVSPAYWALSGFRAIILNGADVNALVLPLAVLVGVGGTGLMFATLRFRFAEAKVMDT